LLPQIGNDFHDADRATDGVIIFVIRKERIQLKTGNHLGLLGLQNLSTRAANIICLNDNGFNMREDVIEAVKSKHLLKLRNCGPITYNEIAKAVGLEKYCYTGYLIRRASQRRSP
jgi:hypothetical protein